MEHNRLSPAYRVNERVVGTVNGRVCVVAVPGDFLTADEAERLGLVEKVDEQRSVRTADVPGPRSRSPKRRRSPKPGEGKVADSE
jgi:enoyl-CoA hydratase/carnithine racemase